MSSATEPKKIKFAESEEGIFVEATLHAMERDERYVTKATYSSDSTKYPNNRMPFVDKHMAFLGAHPEIDARHYIANLRLITRVR